MKKLSLILLGGVLLTGCQTTGSNNDSIASADFQNMSCAEIKQTFDDYQDQMDNLDTGTSLLSAVGVNTGTSEAKGVMQKAYIQAKKAASQIIKVKKCTEQI
ncbi:Metal dependent phosphohydrolase [Moritella viscosa]|uniref:hypothetical protein n=1 Tax=Moritella viscosa TaxID=80854 RepID=UPI00091BA609|nr:hypothetical protein [Moritella viscosa]SHO23863.1 Metal dependent phosphohydrolase [Moritella viscosa]